MTLVLNLYAGPGSGKSTTMAGVFSQLKLAGVRAEMATEYAKDKVWERSIDVLDNQVLILGKQYHRLWRLKDQVDVIVTDSPILLSLIYGARESDAFKALVRDLYGRFDNVDVYLRRKKPFERTGRLQTEEKARQLDTQIAEMLHATVGTYTALDANWQTVDELVGMIRNRLGT